MQFTNVGNELSEIVESNVSTETYHWIKDRLSKIIDDESVKNLYLTYSLLSGKVYNKESLGLESDKSAVHAYLTTQNASLLEVARIYVLVRVLDANNTYFSPKVGNLIQVADTGELETFLRFLILLPNAGDFKNTAVEALRTNIAIVFDAISTNNPYPSQYFNDQQWNQMYLKAAFMQRDLSQIMDIDKRANKDLSRIISDYAHERWAASRDVDPYFWRPVSNFLEGELLEDMKRLLESDNIAENRAGALCCSNSNRQEAKALLEQYSELSEQLTNKEFSWSNLNP